MDIGTKKIETHHDEESGEGEGGKGDEEGARHVACPGIEDIPEKHVGGKEGE